MKIRIHKTSFPATVIFTLIFISVFPVCLFASNQEITINKNKLGQIYLPDSSIYVGKLKNELFEGKGKLFWPNGRVYQGDFKNGLMHGKGIFKYSNGNVYQGEMFEGLLSGKGKLKYKNGDVYTGLFVKGSFDGEGLFVTKSGSSYKGSFKNSDFHGDGRYQSTSGDVYQGIFVDGDATGAGKIEFKSGDLYVGNLKKWKMHGAGQYTGKEGTIYTGQFVKGEMQGSGEVKFKSGNYYKGEIKNWRANGKGEMQTKTSRRYIGEFKDGVYHGQGLLTFKSGNIYKGSFEKGYRQGKGVYTRKNPKGRKKQVTGWWQYDDYVGKNKPGKTDKKKKLKPVNAEAIFYQQRGLLSKKLSTLKFETPFVPDLYMLAFGSAGYQDVFMNEVQFSKHYFDMKLGTKNRSIGLINNHKVSKKIPIASVSNLEISLDYLSRIMDKEQDILFLFLTSHGSKKHVLSVSLRGLPLNNLPAKKLASLLKKTGIKWKVIVISACYSGGFIKELKDDYTMIMTAAKSDHVSFGCSDDADFTYFGRALFKEAIPRTKSFREAFESAKKIVTKMEKTDNYSHSEPQFYSTPSIEAQLKLWRKSFNKAVK